MSLEERVDSAIEKMQELQDKVWDVRAKVPMKKPFTRHTLVTVEKVNPITGAVTLRVKLHNGKVSRETIGRGSSLEILHDFELQWVEDRVQ